jgi:hypothetical protein
MMDVILFRQRSEMNVHSTALVLAWAVLIPLSGCAQHSVSADKPGVVIRTDDFTGVIFRAERFSSDASTKGRYWTPQESDVRKAEEKLVPFLQSELKSPDREWILKRLKSYKRQYLGRVVGGHKEIFINFFCDSFDAPDWTKTMVITFDGGACFFHVHFSPESKTFFELEVNGVG